MDNKGLKNVKQLSDKLGLKYSTVLDWINAKTYPRIDKIELMADFFEVDKSDLIESYKSVDDKDPINKIEQLLSMYNKLEDNRKIQVMNFIDYQIYEQSKEIGSK
ncbi:helix-turn-helix transcriptional regulator [Streptococcaceae bacterium ESL0687]|nr:helix-turn-helix transcriptional regulator [Streptococcaceae bacterium ESL0687]